MLKQLIKEEFAAVEGEYEESPSTEELGALDSPEAGYDAPLTEILRILKAVYPDV